MDWDNLNREQYNNIRPLVPLFEVHPTKAYLDSWSA